MTTLYPSAIDSYGQIRLVSDRSRTTEIDARDHNDLRSAVIAIESTLGLNPQGPFSTVNNRMSDSYNSIALHASGGVPRHMDSDIDAAEKTGTPNTIAAGTVQSQVQKALDYINDFHATTGAALVGATTFTTAKNNYTFASATVQGQIQEAGNFMDLNIDFLRKAFNSFIVSGMRIIVKSIVDLTVDIESGYIASQGMLLEYPGAQDLVLMSTPGNGTFYIYATRVLDVVAIHVINASGINSVLNNIDTIVVLAELVINGSEYTITDMRRFGTFVNDKNCFTVGNTPVSGHDGYGCDFISLKAAVKYISLFQSTGNLLGPSKVMLVDNITINSVAEAEIELTSNMEIDGSSNTIFYSAAAALFKVENNNITIRDLNLTTNFSSTGSNGYFALVAQTNNVSNFKVIDCTVGTVGSVDLNSFIYMCPGGNKTVTGLIVRNNNAAIGLGAVHHPTSTGATSLVSNAIVEGNIFYQSSFVITAQKCIVVGSYSKVTNNIIRGGFNTGIEVHGAIFTDVQGNTIIGENAATYYMDNGIVFRNLTSVVSDNIVSNNIIRGVNLYGINCKAGLGYVRVMSIDNNIIDNSASISPPVNMSAINSYYETDTTVSNNIIYYPGAADGVKTISEATQVIGNYIVCVPQDFGAGTSILIYVVKPGVVVAQNVIKNSTGVCIFVGAGSHGSIISNNTIYETYNGASCIYAIGCSYLTVTNNTIVGSYTTMRNRNGIYLERCDKTSISRNSINNIIGTAISTIGDCSNNAISNNIITEVVIAIDCGAISSAYAIKDNFIIADPEANRVSTESAILGVGSNSTVEGNYIYRCGNGSSNYAIYCNGINAISVFGNVIIGYAGQKAIGIECSSAANSNISGNYLSDVYLGINSGEYTEVSNNKIYTSTTNGINLGGTNCHVTGNYVFYCAGVGINCSATDLLLVDSNYVYMNGSSATGIMLTTSLRSSIIGNYVGGVGVVSSGIIKLFNFVSCQNLLVNSNYALNQYNTSGTASSYGMYFTGSFGLSINSNYLYGEYYENTYNLYTYNASYTEIVNNYLCGCGGSPLTLAAASNTVGRGHLISGNCIQNSSNYIISGIDISDAQINNVNISGNFIYLSSETSGITGINIGDTLNGGIGRHILLNSNFIHIGGTSNKAVTFSNYTAMKVIGNIAIGGVAPDEDIWDGGYDNSVEDNVYLLESEVYEEEEILN